MSSSCPATYLGQRCILNEHDARIRHVLPNGLPFPSFSAPPFPTTLNGSPTFAGLQWEPNYPDPGATARVLRDLQEAMDAFASAARTFRVRHEPPPRADPPRPRETPAYLTNDTARELLEAKANAPAGATLKSIARRAKFNTHPDREGGSAAAFREVIAAENHLKRAGHL